MSYKSILIGLFLKLSFSLVSQERVHVQTANISSTILGEINEATGWMFNKKGQWVSLPNKIPLEVYNQGDVIGSNYKKKGADNFSSIQVRNLIYEGENYKVFIKAKTDGKVENKSKANGWIEFDHYQLWVISDDEFVKLNKIQDSQMNLVELKILGKHSNVDLKDAIAELEENFKPKNSGELLVVHVSPNKNKNIVQFNFYEARLSQGNYVTKPSFTYYDKDLNRSNLSMTDELFTKCYYEAKYSSFENFLNLGSSINDNILKSEEIIAQNSSSNSLINNGLNGIIATSKTNNVNSTKGRVIEEQYSISSDPVQSKFASTLGPLKLKKTNNLSKTFRIQIAALSRHNLFPDLNHLGSMYTQKVPNKNLTRFQLGVFYSKSEANEVLRTVKSLGYSDAFLVEVK